jgi:hypothetical protein
LVVKEVRHSFLPCQSQLSIAESLKLGIDKDQAIIRMSMGDEKDKGDLKSIVGALFFGVPNKGMDITSLIPMAGEQPNRPLLESICKGSSLLQTQSEQFEIAFPFRDSSIISLYETMLSPTAVYVSLMWLSLY